MTDQQIRKEVAEYRRHVGVTDQDARNYEGQLINDNRGYVEVEVNKEEAKADNERTLAKIFG